ncbi:MAG: 1-deoxy-D-xylulose-5-phosphate synthase, partial [Dethiobacteria bacterium]
PVDEHNIGSILNILKQADIITGPVLVHIVTEKGKGYQYAENAPEVFHGIGPFDLSNGLPLKKKKMPTYTDVFGNALLGIARKNEKVVAITAAMTAGTGLKKFSKEFPDRFYDVGIAEQHGVTMAAALAAGGMRPVFAVYSTFLQRAYDQVLHDVCMQNLPVVFAVDRAGIVGEDGETHQGLFDLTYLRSIPNMTVMAPSNEDELQHMLFSAFSQEEGPVAIRYPRDKAKGLELMEPALIPHGRGILLNKGEDLLIIAAGTVVNFAVDAAEKLFWQGIKAAVINARFVKPLDEELILNWARKCGCVLTVEENVLTGGFGSGLLELFEKKGITIPVKRLGVDDCFIPHGTRAQMLEYCGLDTEGIYNAALVLADIKAVREIT